MKRKALVLGGGGVTGVAWELGVLAGLSAAGLDLRADTTVIGTSAGSVVAALLTSGVALEGAYLRQLDPPESEAYARVSRRLIARWVWAGLRAKTPEQFGAALGRMALEAKTMSEAERRAVVASRLPLTTWPDADLRITAVDALTGAQVVFDRHSGVDLLDAVGASCAVPGVWPAVTINGRRYIDGGMRTATNLHLARGFDSVLVVAPIARGIRREDRVDGQAAALRREGTSVGIVRPSPASLEAIGKNVLDPARRAASARAGREQARDELAVAAALWGA